MQRLRLKPSEPTLKVFEGADSPCMVCEQALAGAILEIWKRFVRIHHHLGHYLHHLGQFTSGTGAGFESQNHTRSRGGRWISSDWGITREP
jgi:hypothetical protein